MGKNTIYAADMKIRPGSKVYGKAGTASARDFPEGGKVIAINNTAVGEFVQVNFGTTKNPHMKELRPSQLYKG